MKRDHRARLRRAIATVLAIGLAAASACSGDDDPSERGTGTTEARPPTEPPGWELVDGEPLEPLPVEEEPLWTGDAVAEAFRDADVAVFRGDDLVLWGGSHDGYGYENLGVLDAATGQIRWMVSAGAELAGGDGAELESSGSPWPPVIELADGWAVVAAYRLEVGDELTEYGVAALSGEDGRVLWKMPVVTGTRGDEERQLRRIDVVDGVVLASEGPADVGQLFDQRVVALDSADGSVLWDRPGHGLAGAAGDTALAYPSPPRPDPRTADLGSFWLPFEPMVGLDVANGEVRWDLSDRFGQSLLELTTADLALLLVPVPADDPPGGAEPEHWEGIVVEASSGRELDSFGTTLTRDACAADDELIACVVGVSDPGTEPVVVHDRLATFDTAEREGSVSEATLPEDLRVVADVQAVVDGRIVAEGVSDTSLSLDRFANPVGGLPGRYLAMSDRYAIFEPGDHRDDPATWAHADTYTVHRIGD